MPHWQAKDGGEGSGSIHAMGRTGSRGRFPGMFSTSYASYNGSLAMESYFPSSCVTCFTTFKWTFLGSLSKGDSTFG